METDMADSNLSSFSSLMATPSAAQAQLVGCYAKALPRLCESLRAILGGRKVSSPHLVDLDAHGYWDSPRRLMILGQQTHGWQDPWDGTPSPGLAEALCKGYREFNLAVGTSWENTPFWSAARNIQEVLNPRTSRLGFVWSNLHKIDEGGGTPSSEIRKVLHECFDVLPEEVTLAKPDVVVFLTGPDYDNAIQDTFPGVAFVSVSGAYVRELCRISHPALPATTFRTYHPGFMRRSRRPELGKLLELLAVG
jgi:hypothetical protein